MRFSYLPQRVKATPAAPALDVLYRPVIPVRFHGPKGSTKVRALLDTGADESYITEAIAAELGVTPVSIEEATIHSASGKMSVWYGNVVLDVSDDMETYSFPLVVGVVTADWDELILGHIGFFEHFDAHFSDADKIVTVTARESILAHLASE